MTQMTTATPPAHQGLTAHPGGPHAVATGTGHADILRLDAHRDDSARDADVIDLAAARRPGPGLDGPDAMTAHAGDVPSCAAPVRVSWRARVRQRLAVRDLTADAGMATAEYAVVLLAAVGFAGLLIVILTSSEIREMLTSLVRGALTI